MPTSGIVKYTPISPSQSILPAADNTYDLGSAAKSWRSIYVDTLVYATSVAGDWKPSADDTYYLGSATLGWKGLHLPDTFITDDAGVVKVRNNADGAYVGLRADHIGLALSDIDPLVGLKYSETFGTQSDSIYGGQLNTILSQTVGDYTATAHGFEAIVRCGAGNTQNWTNTVGMYGGVFLTKVDAGATGTITGISTLIARLDDAAEAVAGAIVTDYIGVDVRDATGTGRITNNYGTKIAALTRGGTLNCALYIDTPSGAASNYAIYSTGGHYRLDGAIDNGTYLNWYNSTGTARSVIYMDTDNKVYIRSADGTMRLNNNVAQDIHMWGTVGTGRSLQLLGSNAAAGAGNIADSPTLKLSAYYRTDGDVNTEWGLDILHDMVTGGAAPKSQAKFSINSVLGFYLENNNATMALCVPPTLRTDSGNMTLTPASNLVLSGGGNLVLSAGSNLVLSTGQGIQVATSTDGQYANLLARDVDGAAFVEVARWQNANDPFFGVGLSQETKFYASGYAECQALKLARDGGAFVGAAGFTTTASANLKNSNDTEKSTVATGYTKIKEIKVKATVPGFRITFELKTAGGGATATGRVYKNAGAIGTEQTDVTGGYVTKSEDLTGLVPGDLLQIYAKTSDAGQAAYVQNMRLLYDIALDTTALLVTNQDP